MVKGQNGPQNLKPRKTMIKDVVGKVRRPAFDLPDSKNENHVYGYEVKRDPEDAGQVLSKWVATTPSPAAVSTRSFIETNRRALASGCLDAKEHRLYAQEHQDIREKPPQKKKTSFVPDEKATYGIKTVPSGGVLDLIQAKHTSFKDPECDYPDLSTMKLRGRIPLPRETKASRGKDHRYEGTTEILREPEEPKDAFMIKKFLKVPAQLDTQPKNNHTHAT